MKSRRGRSTARGARRFVAVALVGAVCLVATQSCNEVFPSLGQADTGGLEAGPGAGDGGAPVADAGGDVAPADGGGGAADATPGGPCEQTGCAPGFGCCPRCCVAGLAPACVQLVAHGDGGSVCPLPDLRLNLASLQSSLSFDVIDAGACELEESCLSGPGTRRVLRFDANIANTGASDLVLGHPDAGSSFEFASCHAHYHFKDFARYRLLDDAGAAVVIGRKQAFCARDSRRVVVGSSPQPVYDCNYQGISKGWQDDYTANLPCQWLDVTDLAPGAYRLEIEINPERSITELDYDNNTTRVPIVVP